MATVSEVVLKYAARGAKEAQRADEKVRRGLQQTQKTAQKSTGRIKRWMQANRSAIQAISLATIGFLGALVAASPLARSELGLLRSSFGVLADVLLQPLLPALTLVSLLILDLADFISDLPDPIRTAISVTIFLAAALAALTKLGVIGWLKTTLPAAVGSATTALMHLRIAVAAVNAGMAGLGATIAVFAGAVVAGLLLGVLGTWILKQLGVIDAIHDTAASLDRSLSPALLDLVKVVTGVIMTAFKPFIAALAFIDQLLGLNLIPRLDETNQVMGEFADAAGRTWDRFAAAVSSGVASALKALAGLVAKVEGPIISTLNKLPFINIAGGGMSGAIRSFANRLQRRADRMVRQANRAAGGGGSGDGGPGDGGASGGGTVSTSRPTTRQLRLFQGTARSGPTSVDQRTQVQIDSIQIDGRRRDAQEIVDELASQVSEQIKEGSLRR